MEERKNDPMSIGLSRASYIDAFSIRVTNPTDVMKRTTILNDEDLCEAPNRRRTK